MPVRKNAATKSPVVKEKPKKVLPDSPQGAGEAEKPTKSRKAAANKAPKEGVTAGRKSAANTEKALPKKKTAAAVKVPAKTAKKSTETKNAFPKTRSGKSIASRASTPKNKKPEKATTEVQGSALKTKPKTPAKKKTGLTETTAALGSSLKTEEPAAVKLLKQLRDILDSRKAEDIVILDLREVSGYLDYFLLATALSPLHVRNLANETADLMRSAGYRPLNNISAEIESGWQILDYGEIVVHLFTAEKRAFYNLEKVWEKAARIPNGSE